jgi:hypothetical protein
MAHRFPVNVEKEEEGATMFLLNWTRMPYAKRDHRRR